MSQDVAVCHALVSCSSSGSPGAAPALDPSPALVPPRCPQPVSPASSKPATSQRSLRRSVLSPSPAPYPPLDRRCGAVASAVPTSLAGISTAPVRPLRRTSRSSCCCCCCTWRRSAASCLSTEASSRCGAASTPPTCGSSAQTALAAPASCSEDRPTIDRCCLRKSCGARLATTGARTVAAASSSRPSRTCDRNHVATARGPRPWAHAPPHRSQGSDAAGCPPRLPRLELVDICSLLRRSMRDDPSAPQTQRVHAVRMVPSRDSEPLWLTPPGSSEPRYPARSPLIGGAPITPLLLG